MENLTRLQLPLQTSHMFPYIQQLVDLDKDSATMLHS